MALHIIGIGLGDEKDITLKGLELVKASDVVYLESYTSVLNCPVPALEKMYGKKIVLADREMVESGKEILENAKTKNVSLLIIGDVFAATTHIDIVQRAHGLKIPVTVVHNASVLTAVGETGLQVYFFGKTTSIPFDNTNIVTPIEAYKKNSELGMHTLFLLDLRPSENRFMTVNEGIAYLLRNKIADSVKAVACCALGSNKQIIKYGTLKSLATLKFDSYPQCLIIPGKLHFMEEEYLESFEV